MKAEPEEETIARGAARSLSRALVIGFVAIAVALGAALIGTTMWPRVEQVERKVVAPAVEAVRPAAPAGAADMIAAACPAIVAVVADPPADDDGTTANRQAAAPPPAPGFLVSADGYVVADARPIGDAANPGVTLSDGRTLAARRIGADSLAGLVLLKVDAANLPFLQFADAALPRIGEQAVALAASNGRGCIAEVAMVGGDFTTGAANGRAYARLRPELDDDFDGAPVLGADGRVIGMAGLGAPAGADASPAWLLPGGTANWVVSALMRAGGATATSDFGFIAQDMTPALAARIGTDRQQGAMIALVRPGSAGARASLRAGDVVFTANGTPVANATELARALDGAAGTVTLDVMRGADRLSIAMRTD